MSDQPLFDTDPAGVLFLAVFVGAAVLGLCLAGVAPVPSLKRRRSHPQVRPVDGTGVERTPPMAVADARALPRSPQAAMGGATDPRPVAPPIAPQSPAGVAGSIQPVTFAGLQTPVGAHSRPVASTGPRRVQVHG